MTGTVPFQPGRPRPGAHQPTPGAQINLLPRTGGDAPAHVRVRPGSVSRSRRPALIAIAEYLRRWVSGSEVDFTHRLLRSGRPGVLFCVALVAVRVGGVAGAVIVDRP